MAPAGRVRIWGGQRPYVLGAGILVSPAHVVTAWHVVHDDDQGYANLQVDFPDDRDQSRIPAAVETAIPIGEQGGGDIAVLRTKRPATVDCARLRDGIDESEAHVFGYMNGVDTGIWAAVALRGSANAGTDWYQIDRSPGSAAIDQGFSGSGVYGSGDAVIGMVVARLHTSEHVAAWMLPVRRWAALVPGVSLEAGLIEASEPIDLSFEQRADLVAALGRIPLMMDTHGRQSVARNLPEHIRVQIPASPVTNLDLLGLVDTVLGFPSGFDELYQVLATLAGRDSTTVTRLRELARGYGLLREETA